MKTFREFKELAEAKRGLYANIHAKRKRGERPARSGEEDYPEKDAFKRRRGLPKKVLNLTQNQPGPERPAKTSLEVLTRKEGNLTRERILEATLRHHQRRLEIPVGHPFAPE